MAQELTWKATIDPTIGIAALRQLSAGTDTASKQMAAAAEKQAKAAIAAANQEFKEIQAIHAAKVRMAQQEAREIARIHAVKTRQAETEASQEFREIQQIHAQKLRMAAADASSAARAARQKVAEETRAAREVQRIIAQTTRQAEQQEKARERAAKVLADVQIREGRRALLEIERQLAQQQRVTSGGSGRGAAFLAGAAGGLTALLGISAINEIHQAGAAMIDYASKLETTRIAFTQMTGSADLAEQHLRDLQQFALKTPFQFGELIDASQRMQALGFNAEQVIPILNDVGNAVAAAGGGSERLDRVVLALSQIQSKGRLMTQEMNQLAEAGIPAWKVLEVQLGKSRAELVKMVEQGKISSQVFLEAFQKFSQQNFGGLMEAQSKTFTGAMSNIKDALLQTSAIAFAPLYEKLSKTAQAMSDLAINSKEFRDNMAEVGKVLTTIWDGLVMVFYAARDAYRILVADLIAQTIVLIDLTVAVVRQLRSEYEITLALAQLMAGDALSAYQSFQRSQQQAELATEALSDAVRVQKTVVEAVAIAWEESAARTTRAALAMAQAAITIDVGVDTGQSALGAGIFRKKSAAFDSGKQKKTHSTELRDSLKEAELAQKEIRLKIDANVAENKRALDRQWRDIQEFTKRAIELADQRLNAAIDRVNAEQQVLDRSLAKKLIKQKDYENRTRELTIETQQAVQQNEDEISSLEDARDKSLADAKLAANQRRVQIQEDADQAIINSITDRVSQRTLLESEAEKQIAVIVQEAFARRKAALEEEQSAYGVTLERRKAITDELIQLEGQRAGAAVDASRKVRDALKAETDARRERDNAIREAAEAAALQTTKERARAAAREAAGQVAERTRGFQEGQDGPTGAIDQLFGAIHEHLSGAKQSAALAGLEAITAGMQGLGEAVGQAAYAWVLYGNAGQSVRQVTSQILASIAQQAVVKSIFEFAEGLAALALAFFGLPNAGPSANAHFAASAAYAGIAGVAAISGRALAGNSFSGGGGGNSANGAFRSATSGTGSRSGGGSGSSAPLNLGSQRGPEVLHLQVSHSFKNDGTLHSFVESAVVKSASGNGVVRQVIVKEVKRQE